jgi:hypothetical protein
MYFDIDRASGRRKVQRLRREWERATTSMDHVRGVIL